VLGYEVVNKEITLEDFNFEKYNKPIIKFQKEYSKIYQHLFLELIEKTWKYERMINWCLDVDEKERILKK